MLFATQFYCGLNNGKTWKSLAYDDNLEDAIDTLKDIYDDHISACEERGIWPYHQITDFRIKGLQNEQEFTGE